MATEAMNAGVQRVEDGNRPPAPQRFPAIRPGSPTGYAVALLGVALAAVVAFLAEHLMAAPNRALVFVLPVLVTALSYGWGASILAAAAAVATFDLLFVTPRYSLAVASPADLWALALLAVVAAVASTVAAQSRRRALAAEHQARSAEALRVLAHKVVEAAPAALITVTAAETLAQIFTAPAAVLLERRGDLGARALTGGAKLSKADEEAARWALQNRLATRAQAFPFDTATFDFWPLRLPSGEGVVIGVEGSARERGQPVEAERYVELVGAYLLAGLQPSPSGPV